MKFGTEFKVKKVDLSNDSVKLVREKVAVEQSHDLYINGKYISRFFSLPIQIKELAIGFLLVNKIIKGLNDIREIHIEKKAIRIFTVINSKINTDDLEYNKTLKNNSEATEDWGNYEVKTNYTVRADCIIDMVEQLNEMSEIFKLTGGTHSAAIFQKEKLIAFSEDVSRHNVDKAIGTAALKGVDFTKSILISSGRQPGDMVIKAAKVGMPIVVSISGPVSSGIDVAKKTNITLICFARDKRMNIYTFPERIIL